MIETPFVILIIAISVLLFAIALYIFAKALFVLWAKHFIKRGVEE